MTTIRRARDADREAIIALHMASWRDAYASLLSAHLLTDAIPANLTDLWAGREFGGSDIAFVAEDERDEAGLTGFAYVRTDLDPPLLDNLHVRPGSRSNGTGSALLSATLGALREAGFRAVSLDVLKENGRARAFYARAGGRETRHFTAEIFGEPVEEVRIVFDLT